MGQNVEDPNLEDLPEEAYEEPGESGLSVPQLELRIRAKREQAMQDMGLLTPPQPDEPLDTEEPEVEDEPPPEDTEPGHEEEPEPEEQEEPPQAEAPEAEEADGFYVGRYRTREEAEAALAEARLTIDRLNNEKAMREREEREQEQQQFSPQAWHEWSAEQMEQGVDAREAANVALQHGGEAAYDIFLAHWLADPEQAAQAHAFNNYVQRQVATQHALAAVQPLLQEQQTRSIESEAVQARAAVAARHPDFDELEQEMDRLVLSENGPIDEGTKQWLEQTALTGGVQGKVIALEHLYAIASQTISPKRRQARAAEQNRRKASADAAKVSATVSSSEASGARTPLSEAELAVLAKKNAIRAKLGQPQLPTE